MGTYDVLMLLVVLFAAFLGWQKGMAWQIASIAAIVGSYFVAMQFRDQVAQHINLIICIVSSAVEHPHRDDLDKR